jgi:hypothetical protein
LTTEGVVAAEAIGRERLRPPDLVEREALQLGTALRDVFDAVPEGGRGHVVGHSPTNEAAVLRLTGEVVAPMGKGDGVLIVEDEGRFHVRPSRHQAPAPREPG